MWRKNSSLLIESNSQYMLIESRLLGRISYLVVYPSEFDSNFKDNLKIITIISRMIVMISIEKNMAINPLHSKTYIINSRKNFRL